MFDTFDRNGNAEFPFSKAVVFRAVCQAVKELSGVTSENADELTSRIELKTGMSAFSWGEKVTITVLSSGTNGAVVQVASGAKTIFGSGTSHGKNKQNVSNIISQTSKVLQAFGEQWAKDMCQDVKEPELVQGSVADELIKLALLKDNGILSEAEFEGQKQRILSR